MLSICIALLVYIDCADISLSADLGRYAIVYQYGGLYSDLDCLPWDVPLSKYNTIHAHIIIDITQTGF